MDKKQAIKRKEFVPLAKLKSYNIRNYNFRLILILLVVCGLGVVIVGSASGSNDEMFKQGLGLIIGLVGMAIISLIDYNWILKFYWLIYVAIIGLLLAVEVLGKEYYGAKRWIFIGSISIQPSEFVKILLILFMAKFLTVHKERISKFGFLFIFAGLVGVPLMFIVGQPDLSTTLLTSMVIVTVVYISGLSYKKIAIILAVAVPLVAAMLIYIQQPDQKLLKTYQLNRILSFLYPEEYDDLRYQQENSMLAIGSGKLHGKGLFNDSVDSVKNANYLSEQSESDFVFAVIGEEMGFIGSCLVLGLIFLVVAECFWAAIVAPDMTGRLICSGVACLIMYQTFINVGVTTAILPNTGIPLPFISSGLSSLVSLFGGMGFVLNVKLQRAK